MRITKQGVFCDLTAVAVQFSLVALLTLLPGVNVSAAIYSCPTGNGETAFQDRPCEAEKVAISPDAPEEDNSSKTGYPLGMHPTWFVSPQYAPQPAYCDRLGCDCASQARNFRNGLTAAVADAMFLEAAWHRYAEQVIEMETDPPEGISYLQLQVDIEISACEIQMSQATIRNYAEKAINQLKFHAERAEKRGNTSFDQCDGGNSLACRDVEAFMLYERVEMDLETLQSPRSYFVADAD